MTKAAAGSDLVPHKKTKANTTEKLVEEAEEEWGGFGS